MNTDGKHVKVKLKLNNYNTKPEIVGINSTDCVSAGFTFNITTVFDFYKSCPVQLHNVQLSSISSVITLLFIVTAFYLCFYHRETNY